MRHEFGRNALGRVFSHVTVAPVVIGRAAQTMAPVIHANKDGGCCGNLLLLLASSVKQHVEIINVTETHLTDAVAELCPAIVKWYSS